MVALATMPFARFRTSTIEVDTLEKRYTVQTLELMKRTYPGAEMLLVVGTDMYEEIDSWKDFRRLFDWPTSSSSAVLDMPFAKMWRLFKQSNLMSR